MKGIGANAPFALWALLAATPGLTANRSTAPGTSAATPAILLQVDARDVTRAIQHAHLLIPVHPGPLTLAYPKWIPGEPPADGPLPPVVALQTRPGGPSAA